VFSDPLLPFELLSCGVCEEGFLGEAPMVESLRSSMTPRFVAAKSEISLFRLFSRRLDALRSCFCYRPSRFPGGRAWAYPLFCGQGLSGFVFSSHRHRRWRSGEPIDLFSLVILVAFFFAAPPERRRLQAQRVHRVLMDASLLFVQLCRPCIMASLSPVFLQNRGFFLIPSGFRWTFP